MKYLILFFLCHLILSFPDHSIAQQKIPYPGFDDKLAGIITDDSTGMMYVLSIEISGNKKTKQYIILREMQLKKGDSIVAAQLYPILKQSHSLIYNTNLFSEVDIKPILISGKELSIKVNVKERWYIYPTPQFKLVDRNLNEWIKTYNADLNRVIYGAKFAHYNFSGRGDQMRIYILNGYARTYSFSYSAPYSNHALTEGFSIGAGYSQSREFPYKTSFNNSLLLFKKDGFSRNVLSANASYQLRRGYFRKHIFSLQFTNIKVNDSVITQPYNPGFFNSGRTSAGYPDLSYNFQYSNTDNINYPLQGKTFSVLVSKRGLGFTGGINMLSLDALYRKFIPHKNNWYSSLEFLTKLKAPFKQPYINQKAMGYENFFVRGLEYYVIDGIAAAIAKYTLKKKLFSFDIPVPFHIKALPKIPFTFYAKTYGDLGYNYTQKQFDTRLNNRLLYSGGFGIDILTLYDVNIRLEYSFNQLGENGLFLHSKSGF